MCGGAAKHRQQQQVVCSSSLVRCCVHIHTKLSNLVGRIGGANDFIVLLVISLAQAHLSAPPLSALCARWLTTLNLTRKKAAT